MEITGKCQRCQQSISFAAEEVGDYTKCPHCNHDTALQLGSVPRLPILPLVPPVELTKPQPRQFIEDKLDRLGGNLFICGIFVAALFGVIALFALEEQNLILFTTAFGSGAGNLVGGFVARILCQAFAEHLRLTRAIAKNSQP